MVEKEINPKSIKLTIKQYRHLLPDDTQYLHFFYYNGWKIRFSNSEKEDITSKIDIISLSNGTSLFESIYIDLLELITSKLELQEGTEYFHKIESSSKQTPIFNSDTFFHCRNSNHTSTWPIIKELSISSSTIYKIESNQFIDPSSLVFIKYSTHFKKSLFHFLRKDIAQRMLDICVNEMVIKDFITLDQASNIKKNFFKQ